jgi:hypothetical protein
MLPLMGELSLMSGLGFGWRNASALRYRNILNAALATEVGTTLDSK